MGCAGTIGLEMGSTWTRLDSTITVVGFLVSDIDDGVANAFQKTLKNNDLNLNFQMQ